jgi:FkbM family methyltransferase
MKQFILSIIQEYRAFRHKRNLYKINGHQIVDHLKEDVSINKKWYGNSYGGFFIHPEAITSGDLIVSIGIGKDISFDRTLLKNHNVDVFAFDPTPKSIEWLKKQNLPNNFQYESVGLHPNLNGLVKFYFPKNKNAVSASTVVTDTMNKDDFIEVSMATFDNLVSKLPSKEISILKIDIEGAEYDVIPTLFEDPEVHIKQILIEFHDRDIRNQKYPSIESVRVLKSFGYQIFGTSISSEEVSFIHNSVINDN